MEERIQRSDAFSQNDLMDMISEIRSEAVLAQDSPVDHSKDSDSEKRPRITRTQSYQPKNFQNTKKKTVDPIQEGPTIYCNGNLRGEPQILTVIPSFRESTNSKQIFNDMRHDFSAGCLSPELKIEYDPEI